MSDDDDVEIVEVSNDVFNVAEKLKNQLKDARFQYDKLKVGNCPKHDHCIILDPILTNQRPINRYCHSEEELRNITPLPDNGEKQRVTLLFDELIKLWEILIVNLKEELQENSAKTLTKLIEQIKLEIIQESKNICRAPIASKFIVIILNNISIFDESFLNELFTIWEPRISEILNNSKKFPIEKRTLYDIEFYFGKFLLKKLNLTSGESLDTKILEKSLIENYNELKCYTEDLIK
ncbi:hypothetical protein NAEGRDRAFT_57566 [Naegleria gruberi]|uniref:Uncharacterized protein n=1 Tax=Naegleria gruberi TaxID=5762 RepID=D2V9V1_NAEGR|nr:uncharacterized protein NAEGRDRAFT_57566 [Naegleria gruberi]EFC46310.1 hypothetical protein NAEGRDRAFT_57566 [Naegleria gruberi]|eukprot:XP_002679054.1 hypothetical protein NAEGRDRAFT_57566 [Naegleria gruberi strain NEG-M]